MGVTDLRNCPIEGCPEQHARTKLMCRGHWYKVPKELRDRVWSAYRNEGVFSEEYQEARDAAIASVEAV